MNPKLQSPLDAEEAALAARYASLPGGEPSPAVDARVLAQAHAAVRRRSPALRWGGAAAAVLALGVGVRVVMAPIDLAPAETSEAPVVQPTQAARTTRSEIDSSSAADAAASGEPAADYPEQPRTSLPAPPTAAPVGQATQRSEPAVRRVREEPAATVPPDSARKAPQDAQPASPAPVRADVAAARDAPQPAPPPAPMAAPARADPLAFPPSVAPAPRPQAKQSLPTLPPQEERSVESRERATGASKSTALSASDLEAVGRPEDSASLAELVAEARRLHARGDREGLRALLLRLDQSYPDAALPGDVRGWLDALRDER